MAFDDMDYNFNEQEPMMGYEEEEPQPPPARQGFDIQALLDPIISNPLYLGLGALVIGLLFGFLFARMLPTEFVDAAPENLHENYQTMWMQMMVDSYTLVPDNALAKYRFDAMGDAGADALNNLIAQTSTDPVLGPRVNAFAQSYTRSISNAEAVDPGAAVDPTTGTAEATQAAGEDDGAGRTSNPLVMGACIVGVIAVGAVAFYFLRMRNNQPAGKTAAMKAQEFSLQAEQTDYSGDPPIAQWMTTYLVGDDLFDDSFSIDSMTGEFLGECGVGIADNIGVGEPKRVSAFEVWLFDKNDIQTVTNVLLSEHAYQDEMTLNRLRAKGEPYLALLGGEIELVTKTLRMVVRVMDMDYGAGHLPENSFFQRITLELAVWEL